MVHTVVCTRARLVVSMVEYKVEYVVEWNTWCAGSCRDKQNFWEWRDQKTKIMERERGLTDNLSWSPPAKHQAWCPANHKALSPRPCFRYYVSIVFQKLSVCWVFFVLQSVLWGCDMCVVCLVDCDEGVSLDVCERMSRNFNRSFVRSPGGRECMNLVSNDESSCHQGKSRMHSIPSRLLWSLKGSYSFRLFVLDVEQRRLCSSSISIMNVLECTSIKF